MRMPREGRANMGPYCKFCGERCFVPFPEGTPKHILEAYGSASIIATCRRGQEFERQKIGYCYDDIQSITNNGVIMEQTGFQLPDD
jgi:hypothetical protein